MSTAAKLNVEFASSGVGKVKNDISDVGGALDRTNKSGGNFLSNMFSTGGGMLLAGGFSQLKDSVLGFGGSLINSHSNMEDWTMQLEISTGSVEGATAVLDDMKKMAAESPFEMPELIQAANALESLGFSSQKWMPIIGDTAAATGKSVDQVTQAVMDASTGEFERLKELGIRTTVNGDKIAFSFKKNGKDITVEADNTAEGIENALMGIWDDKYDGAMDKMADSWTGRLGTLKDNLNMMMMDASKPLFDLAKSAVGGANQYLDAFTRRMEQGQGVVHSLLWAIPETLRNLGLEGLAEMVTPAIKGIETGITRLSSVMRSAGRVVSSVLGKAFEFLGDHMDVVKAAGKALVTVFAGMLAWGAITAIISGIGLVLGALLSPIMLIVGAVTLLYLAWDNNWFGIREAVAKAWAGMEPIFNWIKEAIQYIVDGFDIGGWTEVWSRVKSVVSEAWGYIKDFISDIDWGAMWAGLQSAASTAIGWVVDQISSVDWSGFLAGAWGVIQNGLQLAWDAITSLNWSDFIPKILDLGKVLLEKVASLPWGDYIDGVIDIVTWLADKVGKIPWGDIITGAIDIVTWLADKVGKIPWGTLITGTIDLVQMFTDWFGTLPFPEWPSKDEILSAVKDWLLGGGEDEPLPSRPARQRDPSERPVDYEAKLRREYAISNLGSNAGAGVQNAIRDWMGKDNQILPGGFMAGGGMDTKGAVGDIQAMLDKVVAANRTAWQDVVGATAAGSSQAQGSSGSAFAAIQAQVTGSVGATKGAVNAGFGEMAAAVMARSSEAQIGAAGRFASLQAGVTGEATRANTNVSSQFSSMSVASAGHFMGMQAKSALQMALLASTAKTQGSATATNLTGALSGAVVRTSAILGQIPGIVSGIGGQAAGNAFRAGANIGSAFAEGMEAYLGRIRVAASNMVAAADAAVLSRARITSPSKMAQYWANMIGEGFVGTLESWIDPAGDAAAALVQPPDLHAWNMRTAARGSAGGGTVVNLYQTNNGYTLTSAEWLAQQDKIAQAPEKTIDILKQAAGLTGRVN